MDVNLVIVDNYGYMVFYWVCYNGYEICVELFLE